MSFGGLTDEQIKEYMREGIRKNKQILKSINQHIQ